MDQKINKNSLSTKFFTNFNHYDDETWEDYVQDYSKLPVYLVDHRKTVSYLNKEIYNLYYWERNKWYLLVGMYSGKSN